MEKTTFMKAALQHVDIPRETKFTFVKAEEEISKDINIINAIEEAKRAGTAKPPYEQRRVQ